MCLWTVGGNQINRGQIQTEHVNNPQYDVLKSPTPTVAWKSLSQVSPVCPNTASCCRSVCSIRAGLSWATVCALIDCLVNHYTRRETVEKLKDLVQSSYRWKRTSSHSCLFNTPMPHFIQTFTHFPFFYGPCVINNAES